MTTAETPQQFLINAIGFSNCGYMNLQQYGNLVQKIAELLSTREKLDNANQQLESEMRHSKELQRLLSECSAEEVEAREKLEQSERRAGRYELRLIQLIRKQQAELSAMRVRERWIPISDKPQRAGWYNVCSITDGHRSVRCWDDSTEAWMYPGAGPHGTIFVPNNAFTHYCELPTPLVKHAQEQSR